MSHRVLVVEDNAANLELITDWLEVEGYEVKSAVNLAQAFAHLEGQLPEIVLLDVQLGAEDGLVVAETARKDPRWRELPIIAVTAHAMVTDQERVMRAGCNACVSKPVDFSILKSELNRWLTIAANLPSRG
jgi:CheY-like chemotaxis protein